MNTITFTRSKLAKLREKYDKANMNGHEQFQFEGHTLLVTYAKYLIEYLEMEFMPDTREIPGTTTTTMNTLELTPSEIVTLKAALSVAADALLEQAGWCGDNASEEELRYEAQEYHELYRKLDK